MKIGESASFTFVNNKEDLSVKLNCLGGWRLKSTSSSVERISFTHVWQNMSILHCEYQLEKQLNELPCLRLELAAQQENGQQVYITCVAFS
jgi:hypothetical protein